MKPTWTIRRHVLAWVILSGFALVYLASLIIVPMTRDTQVAEPADTPIVTGTTVRADRSHVRELKALRAEIAALRRQIDSLRKDDKALNERIDVVEAAFGPMTAALPKQAAGPDVTGSLKEGRPERMRAPLPDVSVSYHEMPEDGFGDELLDRSPLPVAGVAISTQTLFGVELARGKTANDVHRQWATLGQRHKALLGGLEARHDKAAEPGAQKDGGVKLIAGPFRNAESAARLCARLRAAGEKCQETVFAGESF